MRPLRLYIENFGSFREPVTVDFTDVDYFALVGSTGAGKSTVIDAICFALYGTVPRWNNENAIAHALAPSANAGKVATVVELTDLLGAVIKSVAEGDAVKAEVQRITGLEYKSFTQCVVLPQGQFAQFLHAQPHERQKLLIQLLGAEVYDQIRESAHREEGVARQSAALARDQLTKLADADEAAERAAVGRLASLRAFMARARADIASLRAQDETLRKLKEKRKAAAKWLAPLADLAMPGDVPTLAETLRQVDDEATAQTDEVARLEAEEQQTHDDLTALADKVMLAAELAEFDEHDQLSADLTGTEAKAARAQDELHRFEAEAEAAATALTDAERERDRLRDAHAAAELAQRLSVGDPCPTCLRPVTELPHHPALSDLETVEHALDAARKKADQVRARHGKAETKAAVLTRDIEALTERLAGLSLAGDRDEIESRLDKIKQAEETATRVRRALRAARSRLGERRRQAEEAKRKSEQLWRGLNAARDKVVTLGAPPVDRDDLHRAWTELLHWRDRATANEQSALAVQDQGLARMEARREAERAVLLRRLTEHKIALKADLTPDAIAETVVMAVTRAEEVLELVRRTRRLARDLEEQVATKEQEARVAHELTQLLRADTFKGWLCFEALEVLVTAASDTLRELSDGQYELALSDKSEIEVIDYTEAGMRRNVRTLSGGETFQAALALALTLSEHVAGLAATTARSLDSIFLDEGFGTLDSATLDTVATTLERLATSRERMVGLVTHVPALADRVPVRFEITRDSRGSHLRKAAP